jgi:hypothetical protein
LNSNLEKRSCGGGAIFFPLSRVTNFGVVFWKPHVRINTMLKLIHLQ